MSEIALVTGATGFVGSAVARALLAEGHRVKALVRPNSDRRNLAGLDAEPVTGDLDDPASLVPALKGCTALFHVAADYRLWVPQPQAMLRTNVAGTAAILRAAAAAGVSRAVYTSSVATLGHHADGRPADETTIATEGQMIGLYKRSKFLAENAAREAAAETGLPVVIVNPSTPIGPRDVKPTPTGRIIVEAATGRIPAFVDTGLNLVHVDDVARGHLSAFARGVPGERYILGGEDFALSAILAEIAGLVGRKAPKIRLPLGPIWPVALAAEAVSRFTGREPMVTRDALRMARKTMYFSSDKARAALDYRPRPARQALVDALDWFRGNGYLK
ncbi:hopanoid-associated sugar epimerase [Inquilinus sp. Marseille-Q2685]|uniref:hopanoid-associated sugar epimerase n=1 Tax=Inquilinus sp. Marseille-Q2685 TaxID=2866581 RepID=UPI001CE3F694|nr:hopanoid-associated sugar epimerase [Inquilinus sp. Marseille-Q2685]